MRVEFINPFLQSISKAFDTMLHCPVERGELSLKAEPRVAHEVSGIIGLSGRAVGTVVVTLSEPVALGVASALLMCEQTEVNADVLDAVGELTNVIAGQAKAQFEELNLSISLPSVVRGRDYQLHFPSDVHPIVVHYNCPWGPLALEVGMEVREPATT